MRRMSNFQHLYFFGIFVIVLFCRPIHLLKFNTWKAMNVEMNATGPQIESLRECFLIICPGFEQGKYTMFIYPVGPKLCCVTFSFSFPNFLCARFKLHMYSLQIRIKDLKFTVKLFPQRRLHLKVSYQSHIATSLINVIL